MKSGYLFFKIFTEPNGTPVKGSPPISTTKMSTKLKEYARAARETQNFHHIPFDLGEPFRERWQEIIYPRLCNGHTGKARKPHGDTGD